jgi:imidazolonepropionase-like amidohydrolase
MDEQEALKMVTINPATMLHVADRTGSIKIGKMLILFCGAIIR